MLPNYIKNVWFNTSIMSEVKLFRPFFCKLKIILSINLNSWGALSAFLMKRTAASCLLLLVVAFEVVRQVVALLNLWQIVTFWINWKMVAYGKLPLMAICHSGLLYVSSTETLLHLHNEKKIIFLIKYPKPSPKKRTEETWLSNFQIQNCTNLQELSVWQSYVIKKMRRVCFFFPCRRKMISINIPFSIWKFFSQQNFQLENL